MVWVCELQKLWCTDLVAPRHVEYSWTGDGTRVPWNGRQIPIYCPPGKSSIYFQFLFHCTEFRECSWYDTLFVLIIIFYVALIWSVLGNVPEWLNKELFLVHSFLCSSFWLTLLILLLKFSIFGLLYLSISEKIHEEFPLYGFIYLQYFWKTFHFTFWHYLIQ